MYRYSYNWDPCSNCRQAVALCTGIYEPRLVPPHRLPRRRGRVRAPQCDIFRMHFYDRTYFGDYDPKWFGFLNVGGSRRLRMRVWVGEEAHRRYWRGHYERLVGVKKVFDPERVFEGPQLVGS